MFVRPLTSIATSSASAARLDVLDYDPSAAYHSSELAKAGTPIGPYDQMIAGHARSRGLILVTNNLGEFSRVPGLRVEDWI
ncbi:PIN domain-containing protein [Halomonas sp. AOP42-C2-23]|uniref:PIN domain-containing protein n=1 Tax=Halomonas TaxID=2745 RepID=UPI002679D2F7